MTEFVIVVEVDHQRAQRAFQKAYDDVMLVWPQALAKASAIDQERLAKEEADKAEAERLYKEAVEEYKRKVNERRDARAKLEAWEKLPWWDRSIIDRPPEPANSLPCYPTTGYTGYSLYAPPYATNVAESYLARLKKLKDIANVACAPYRMVESDALQMAAWESGEEWERFYQRFLA